jgi:predicted ATPase/class 3 adenylate cyclase
VSRSSLPEGVVTFLFTDIEGSTNLLHRLGEGYTPVLLLHREILDAAIAEHGGVVVRTEGDAYFAAFDKASTAVAAAIAAQRALACEQWPTGSPLRVRMGLHSGEVEVVHDDYVGLSVHVAARVSAAAHGGQIVITEATSELAGLADTLDLGRHLLKDVGEFHLLQVRAPELEASFPPLRTMNTPHNLPAPIDSFVGRHDEMARVTKAFDHHRLVTLTGAGGSGKTRLATETAMRLLSSFPDGVWFVGLAALPEGQAIEVEVARVLRVGDRPGEAIADSLEAWLQNRRVLLLLDNCEHIVGAVAAFCERFLRRSAGLHILATSREVLGVQGEDALALPPLWVPDDADAAVRSDAVELFVERASAVSTARSVREGDLATVARICRRLDGLPLAIELAAARLRFLSLTQLESRLDDRFRLLAGSGHREEARQRTLEAVVSWSYDLLDDAERAVFRRLAVFPDHFTLDMAEGVVPGGPVDPADVVELVARLVDKSLVTTVVVGDDLRFNLLETLRQYGAARLRDEDAADKFQRRLFDWAMRGVDELSAAMRTPAQDDALREAGVNAATYRSAMQWATKHGDLVAALRIASLVPIIHHRGERRATIEALLCEVERLQVADDMAAGEAWAAIGNIAFEQDDAASSLDANQRATGHFRAAGQTRLAAWSQYLAVHSAWAAGDLEEVDRLVSETVTHFRREGDDMGLGYCLWVASLRNDDLLEADAMAEEADQLLRNANVPMGIAHNLEGRGIIALERGDMVAAAAAITEALQVFASYGNLGCTAHTLEAAAVVIGRASDRPNPVTSELIGAAEAFRLQSGQGHRPWEIRARIGSLEEHASVRDDEASAQAREDGASYDLTTAVSIAASALRTVAEAH